MRRDLRDVLDVSALRPIDKDTPIDAAAMEAASERDRRYFEEHPEQDYYVREYMRNEFVLEMSDMALPDLVEVIQLEPGRRVRRSVWLVSPHDSD